MFRRLRNEMQAAQELTQESNALCTEQGFTLFLAWGTVLQGSVMVKQGEEEKSIAYIKRGFEAHRATGGALRQPYWLGLLAETYSRAGKLQEALTLAAEALGLADETEERWCQAELYRLKGELLLRHDDSNAAEAQHCLVHAIDIARNQTAKSFELRATISLARLLAKLGRCDEARARLAEIYGWFTEGFDTPDLKDAKALLDELSA
jgi:predicted ATPase